MIMTTNPAKFAEEFKQRVPGAYRDITSNDIRLMTACDLIGHYGCYGESDIRNIVGVLRYETLREKRIEKPQPSEISATRICKLCGNALPVEPAGNHGRHKEYCASCESARPRDRYRKWRQGKGF